MAINDKKVKYDSGINVLGSIPDYAAMLEFICEYTGKKRSQSRHSLLEPIKPLIDSWLQSKLPFFSLPMMIRRLCFFLLSVQMIFL